MKNIKHLAIVDRARLHRDAVALRSGSEQYTSIDLLTRSELVAALLLDARDGLNEARIAYLLPAGFDHIAVLEDGYYRIMGRSSASI